MSNFNWEQWIRPHLLELEPYSSARSTHSGADCLLLDANELPFGAYNRYPDPLQMELKQELSRLKQVPVSQIFLGNGSDEIISLCFQLFCEPRKDAIIICPPTYGMYEVAARIADIPLKKVKLLPDFQLDMEKILQTEAHLLVLCSPNNPTGNQLKELKRLLNNFKGIVLLDEAYIDFNEQESLLPCLQEFPNLIILQTLSKAWGLAGARIGMAFAAPDFIRLLNNIKPPYNVSRLNQEAALQVLKEKALFEERLLEIQEERKRLEVFLSTSPLVEQVYPSVANFLLVQFSHPVRVQQELLAAGILVRDRSKEIPGCLRISIGTKQENQQLINVLAKLT